MAGNLFSCPLDTSYGEKVPGTTLLGDGLRKDLGHTEGNVSLGFPRMSWGLAKCAEEVGCVKGSLGVLSFVNFHYSYGLNMANLTEHLFY